jgi:hypothetical protein
MLGATGVFWASVEKNRFGCRLATPKDHTTLKSGVKGVSLARRLFKKRFFSSLDTDSMALRLGKLNDARGFGFGLPQLCSPKLRFAKLR